MRSTKVEKRTYPAHGGAKRVLTAALLFLSCLLILSGLLGDRNSGIIVETKVTPTPTLIAGSFDETPTARELTITSRSWFTIQLGAYENEDSAKIQAATYAQRGAAGFVRHDSRYRVLAALYPTREDAQTVRQQLKSQHDIDSYVYEIVLPEIVLSLKGAAGQLDALEAGFQFLPTVLEEFCDLSVSMDGREMDMEQVLTSLAGLSKQADTLFQVINQRFPEPRLAVIKDLLSILTQVTASSKLTAEKSTVGSVAMATQMKYETLLILTQVETYLNGLS